MSKFTKFFYFCQGLFSLGYNNIEHFYISKIEAFRKIERIWNEGREVAPKIKVEGRNLFEQIKELTSYHDNFIINLFYAQKRKRSRICKESSF
jgi:hypothetical protein